MRLQFKNKVINWLAVTGVLISFLGSLLLAFDVDSRIHAINNRLTGFDRVEYGWNLLITQKAADSAEHSFTFLQQGNVGFQEILAIILDSHPEYAQKSIVVIVDATTITFDVGRGSVPIRIISLLQAGANTPDAVSNEDTLREWIKSARQTAVVFGAARFLVLGFGLNLVGQLISLELESHDSKNRTPSDVSTQASSLS